MVQFFMFFVIFLVFRMISLRLKLLKVDEGFLRDRITCYDLFMNYVFRYYKHKQAK